MEQDWKEVSLENLNKGAAVERWAGELKSILENIEDPNTEPTAVREITLTVKFRPSEDRSIVRCFIGAKSKLAPPAPVETHIHLTKEKGKLKAFENQLRQGDLPMADNVTQMPRRQGED